MHVLTRVWWLPKYGNTPKEYEDAFCPRDVEQEADVSRFAVADGATETSFSGQWAELLVHAYCRGKFTDGRLWQNLPIPRRQWSEKVRKKPLAWYAEEKLQMGAYSSLIGLTAYGPTDPSEVARWDALAIGDSCVFQIRNEDLILKWPLETSDQFGYHPILLSSKRAPNEESSEQRNSGEWVKGDLFYLMTDAIAHWYLKTVEQGGAPREVIPGFGDNGASQTFSDWVAGIRDSGQMRNDDVTLMRVLLS